MLIVYIRIGGAEGAGAGDGIGTGIGAGIGAEIDSLCINKENVLMKKYYRQLSKIIRAICNSYPMLDKKWIIVLRIAITMK